jgi:hypothetical protein
LLNGGITRGEALGEVYTEKHYHQPSDEWSTEWDFSGMAEDVTLLHNLGRTLANSRLWPEWGSDSEFKAARDATTAERAGGTPVLPAASYAPAPTPVPAPAPEPETPAKGERG